MKIITLILLLLVISCSSPEKKIKDSFKFQRGRFKIESVQIYDTIYSETISENVEYFHKRKVFLEKSIRRADEYRDSILKLEYPKSKRDSLIRIGARWRRERQKDLETTTFKSTFTDILNSKMNDTIAGYYVKIITRYDTLNFITDPTFQIVCLVSMYEK